MKMFQLKNDIGFPQEFLKKRNKELPLVSIHFRRTDYKYENELYILDFDYYKSAIQYLQKGLESLIYVYFLMIINGLKAILK